MSSFQTSFNFGDQKLIADTQNTSDRLHITHKSNYIIANDNNVAIHPACARPSRGRVCPATVDAAVMGSPEDEEDAAVAHAALAPSKEEEEEDAAGAATAC